MNEEKYIVYYEYGNGASYYDEFATREEADAFIEELWEDYDMYSVTTNYD